MLLHSTTAAQACSNGVRHFHAIHLIVIIQNSSLKSGMDGERISIWIDVRLEARLKQMRFQGGHLLTEAMSDPQ